MKNDLSEYKRKRNFSATKEPSGDAAKKRSDGGGKKFVVQFHAARREHYDFRLEYNGALLSWAVPKGPSFNPQDKRLAVMVEEHPLEYSEFEGTIPKGEYGGGTVMLWDEGTYEPLEDFESGLKEGSLKFTLYGKRLCGSWALVRMKTEDSQNNWLLIKENDSFKKREAGIEQYSRSVRTNRTMREIAEEEKPARKKNPEIKREVELCKSVDVLPDGDEWLFEVKYDGYRMLAFCENGNAKLFSRSGRDYTEKFAAVSRELERWSGGGAYIFDGEIVSPDENGRTDFQALQAYEKNPKGNIVYVIFDLLAADGKDLRELPLIERKCKLSEILKNAPDMLRESGYIRGRGRESAEAAKKLGLEGIVGKKADSPYRGGRNSDWVKYKCYLRQEFVLGGYTRTEKKTSGISALLLGVYGEQTEPDKKKSKTARTHKKLQYAGRAGTGLNRRSEAELMNLFSEYAADSSPFSEPPKASGGEEIFWLSPELVGEVQFAEWTNENRLRQASFKGLRADKSASEVVAEVPEREKAVKRSLKKSEKSETKKKESEKNSADEIIVCGVKISSPDKIVFPDCGITKAEVARYYEAAASRMLEYAGNRVLSVVRCHEGVGGGCFFNKHPVSGSRAQSIDVKSGDGETHAYFYVNNKEELIAEAQLGGLEYHVWGSRADLLETPDTMVFDLDPDEGLPLSVLRDGVSELKSTLMELKLRPLLKTSGGKGYHIVVPFPVKSTWEEFRAFSKKTAKLLSEKHPELFTDNLRKEKRKNKIFIDWGRNTRGATWVAPYSLRARPGAKVSMPIAWSELNNVTPNGIDMFEALERLKGKDVWK